MMGRALLIIGALATLGLVAAAVLGYLLTSPVDPEMPRHVLVSLASALLMLFSHCWILFYLIGTGKAIKEAVKEYGLDASVVEQTKTFKTRSNPMLMLAMLLVIATFVVGGGVATGSVPSWVHHALFWATLIVQVRALWIEKIVLDANEKLMADLDRRVAALPARA